MSFELQLSSAIFARVIRNRLKRQANLCVDYPFVLDSPFDKLIGRLVVDQIIVSDETKIQREKRLKRLTSTTFEEIDNASQNLALLLPTNYPIYIVPYMQVSQGIDVVLVREDELIANGTEPSKPFITLRLFPTFNISAQVPDQTQGGSQTISLAYTLAYIHPGNVSPYVSDAQLQQIEALVGGIALPAITIDLSPIASTATLQNNSQNLPFPNIINAGIATNDNGSIVALRLESDIYRSPVRLGRTFFENGPDDLLNGKDWAFQVDDDVLIDGVHDLSVNALSKIPGIKLRSGPVVRWEPGGPAAVISVRVEVTDACPFFGYDIDMDVNVSVRSTFSIPPGIPDILRIRHRVEGTPAKFGEELGCAVTAGLLWPFMGPLLLKDENPTNALSGYLAGLLVPPLLRIAAVIFAIETKTLEKDVSEHIGDNCRKIDDKTYECDDGMDLLLQLNPPLVSRLQIQEVIGCAAGLVFRGVVLGFKDVTTGTATVTATPLEWTLDGACRRGFRKVNQAQIEVTGEEDNLLCFARKLTDDPGEAYEIIQSGQMITLRTRTNAGLPAYGCTVRIITRRGVRTLTFPPPQPITAAETERLEKLRKSFEKACQLWKDTFIEREVVNWGLDDPIDQIKSIHSWEIVLHDVDSSSRLALTTVDGRSVLEANASENGVVHMMAMFKDGEAPEGLVLHYVGDRAIPRSATITVRQTLFKHRFSFPIIGVVHYMNIEESAESRTLIIHDDASESIWDVTSALQPLLLNSIKIARADRREQHEEFTATRLKQRIASPAADYLEREGWLVSDVVTPRIGGIRESVLVSNADKRVLFDVIEPSRPRLMQTYFTPPWFESIASSGQLLAKYEALNNKVDLYLAVQSARDNEILAIVGLE
jgi:hypothetical protein